MLKKILTTLNTLIFLIIFLAIPMSNMAIAENGKGFNINDFEKTSGLTKTGAETGHTDTTARGIDLELTIGYVINIALSLVGVIFLILMLYSGYLWMTAKDDNKAIDKAKENIKTALTGLIIVFGAYAITKLILGLLETTVNK